MKPPNIMTNKTEWDNLLIILTSLENFKKANILYSHMHIHTSACLDLNSHRRHILVEAGATRLGKLCNAQKHIIGTFHK